MEVISGLKSKKKRFNYFGKGTEFALIYLKNLILTIITLGFYYPWSKVEQLKYLYQSTELDQSRFTFHGTGKETFKGFLKIYIIIILLYSFLIYGAQTGNSTITAVFIGVFYLLFILILPFALHGTAKYRASKSSWKGIHFKYLGDRMELFWKFIIGFILSIFTLGIYSAWFSIDIRKYIYSHLRFGSLSFNFRGTGEALFWINLKFILLFIPTLGIYSFWYYKKLLNFYAENTEITQNGKKINFSFHVEVGDVFELVLINILLIIFTLGIGYPFVKIRTLKFIFRFLEIEEGLNTEIIQRVSYEDETNDNSLDILDIDLV